MPSEYSVQFHDVITATTETARLQLAEAEQSGDDHKLPRRLQGRSQ